MTGWSNTSSTARAAPWPVDHDQDRAGDGRHQAGDRRLKIYERRDNLRTGGPAARKGKSDPIDAYAAARAALSATRTTVPKTGDGIVEAIRALRVTRRGSPWGGRWDATPCPAQPDLAAAVLMAGHLGDLPARRGHGPHRLTRSFGRPSKSPDHRPESSADQRTSFVISQRCISLLNVVSSAETAHRRPRSGILNAESVHAASGGGPWLSWLGELGV
jgi:hypothetical protein